MSNIAEPAAKRQKMEPLRTDVLKVVDITDKTRGDLVIHIGKHVTEYDHLIRVHKEVLMLASPVFRAMLGGGFAEGTRDKQFDEANPLFLVDDDYFDFVLFCRILHHTISEVPVDDDLDRAPGIACIADKYDCAPNVLRYYMGPLNACIGRNILGVVQGTGELSILDAACIAHLAGDKQLLWRATRYAVAHFSKQDWKDVEVNHQMRDLLPSGLWDEVNNIRVRQFEKLAGQEDFQIRLLLEIPGDRINTICMNAMQAIAIHDLMLRKHLGTTEWKMDACSLIEAWTLCKNTASRMERDLMPCDEHPVLDNERSGCMSIAEDMDAWRELHINEVPGVCLDCMAAGNAKRLDRVCEHAKDF